MHLWTSRVPSSSNPADPPSGGSISEIAFLEKINVIDPECPISKTRMKSYDMMWAEADEGIRSNRCETYVKPMWTLSTWQRCEAQSYVWCAAGATFGLPLDCQSGKQMLLRIVPASFISTFFIFTCLCIAERERVSVVVVGSMMFWVFMFYVYFI